jgi:hypothetical protein
MNRPTLRQILFGLLNHERGDEWEIQATEENYIWMSNFYRKTLRDYFGYTAVGLYGSTILKYTLKN